jgi:hypothetical protein
MAIRELIRQNDPDCDMSKADKVWLQTWIHSHDVVDVLKTSYLKDKAAFRARLYGLTD